MREFEMKQGVKMKIPYKKILPALAVSFFSLEGANGVIEKEYIAKFLPQKPVIVDAGAHTGKDSCEMARLWPHSIIYAFEPVPEVYARLVNNCKKYTNIYCSQLALAAHNGTASLYVSSGSSDGSSSLLKPKDHLIDHPQVQFNDHIIISTNTLDAFAQEHGISHIDFLWLDLQGAELLVLQASPKILKTVQVIYTEVNLHELYEKCALYNEYKAWLESEGFVAVREEIPWKDAGNVLFVRA